MTEKQKKPLTKNEKIGGFVLFVIAVALVMLMCGGEDKEEPAETAKFEQSSKDLLTHLRENVNLSDGWNIEIEEFNKKYCRVKGTIPEEIGKTGADVFGIGVCNLTTKWLVNNGYSVNYDGVTVSCYIVSPYIGVTEKEGMVTVWGRARYDSFSDSVNWEWEKGN